MKPYTQFISRIYGCFVELYSQETKNVDALFAEDPDEPFYSKNQEYAILRNEYARLFVSVIQNNLALFDIPEDEYQLKQSMIFPDAVKVVHSCYPKNLRRWLSGTLSRKKKCRIEFCVLSRDRVRQIEAQALRRGRHAVRKGKLSDILSNM